MFRLKFMPYRPVMKVSGMKMVAITGSLAMDNADLDADIDFLIVTEPGRLWVCRAMIAALGLSAGHKNHLCFNFF